MNDQQQQLVNESLETVLRWAEATEGFAVEQAPLLAQEIVRYGIISNAVAIVIALLIALPPVIISWRCGVGNDVWKSEPTSRAVACIVFGLFGFVASIHMLATASNSIPSLIKASLAPRLYILEQISGLLG